MQIRKEQFLEITNEDELNLLKEAMSKDETTSFDTETYGLGWEDLPFMQTIYAAGTGFVIDKRRSNSLWIPTAQAVFNTSKCLLGHHMYFDLVMARKEWGLRYERRVHDTMLQLFLENENARHGLKPASEALWGEEASRLQKQVEDWFDDNNQGVKNFDKVPFELMSHYAVQDTFLTYHLDKLKRPAIEAEFKELYETECWLTQVLSDMRYTGVRLDTKYLESLVPTLEQEVRILEPQIFQLAGKTFNIGSDDQLAEILYQDLKLPVKVTTTGGKNFDKQQPSTAKEALVSLDHPIGRLILNWRDKKTSLNTFVKPWLGFADKEGYIHPALKQTGTRAGRFSSEDPNAQQIPKRSPSAKLLRKAFIYPEDKVGGSSDQSQIEMVGFAWYSGDPVMKQALREGTDLHKATAVHCGIAESPETCTSDQRKLGKGSNFAIVFGCGAKKIGSFLSQDMYAGRYVSPEEGLEIIGKYKAKFTTVTSFSQRVIQTIRTRPDHSVKNMWGRKMHLSWDKAYVGVNRIVQSWAADTMKRAMVRIWRERQGTDLRLTLNVHDDLKWYSSRDTWMDHAKFIDKMLTECPQIDIPIRCETTRSYTNWAEEEVVKL